MWSKVGDKQNAWDRRGRLNVDHGLPGVWGGFSSES